MVGAGKPEAALTVTEAAIQGAMAVLIFRKQHKPALGPVGDSLDDVGAAHVSQPPIADPVGLVAATNVCGIGRRLLRRAERGGFHSAGG